jgi:hypothetical protein
MLYDSIAGSELAVHIAAAPQWSEFSLYRVTPVDGAVSVSAALAGLGEAWLDDLTIQVVDLTPAQAWGSPASPDARTR